MHGLPGADVYPYGSVLPNGGTGLFAETGSSHDASFGTGYCGFISTSLPGRLSDREADVTGQACTDIGRYLSGTSARLRQFAPNLAEVQEDDCSNGIGTGSNPTGAAETAVLAGVTAAEVARG